MLPRTRDFHSGQAGDCSIEPCQRLAPALVTTDDIVELNLDGEAEKSGGPKFYLERFIHAAIYKCRPDVQAVVHSHSATLVQFGIVKGLRLKPVCHMCGFLGEGAPVFEIREVSGDGPLASATTNACCDRRHPRRRSIAMRVTDVEAQNAPFDDGLIVKCRELAPMPNHRSWKTAECGRGFE